MHPSFIEESLLLFEANIDDMVPTSYELALEFFLEAGALDVFITPILMKKSRPAQLLSVLSRPELKPQILALFFEHTSTLGVRETSLTRYSLPRKIIQKETPWGPIRFKESHWQGKVRQTPEYDDCKAAAKRHRVSLKTIYDQLL